MDCLDALAEIDAELAELTHPLGSIAYQKAGTQRAEAPSGRDVLAYDDAPAPPLMDDELAKAKQLDAAVEAQGLLYGRDKAPPEGKKRKGREGGVALPQWMDLDQETLPNAPTMSARAKRPAALDTFGGVGELTVQMRTARGGLGGDRAFDALLSHHERAKGREEARSARERGEKVWGAPHEGYVCHICQQPGHWIQNCPHAQPRSSGADSATPPEDYVCHFCSVPGHWRQNCPTAAAAAEGGAADGDGAGRAPKAQRTAPLSAEQRVAGVKGKPPSGYVCNLCREQGHWIDQCPYKDNATPPAGYVCHKCHQAGHWRHLCPAAEPRTARGSAAAAEAEAAPPLAVEMEHEIAGDEISEALDEEDAKVRHTVARVVAALGEEVARQLLVQTWQVEEQGGLLTVDGTNRRRSPGGVFLWLVKQAATATQRLQIWPPAAAAAAGDGTAAAGAPARRKTKSGGGGGADAAAAGKGGGKGGRGGRGGRGGGKGGGKGGRGAKAAAKNESSAAPLAACGDPAAHPGAADPAGGDESVDDWADDLAAMLEARGDEIRTGVGAKQGPGWEPRA